MFIWYHIYEFLSWKVGSLQAQRSRENLFIRPLQFWVGPVSMFSPAHVRGPVGAWTEQGHTFPLPCDNKENLTLKEEALLLLSIQGLERAPWSGFHSDSQYGRGLGRLIEGG